ncbi:MAG: FCD domain-containing protein [Alphaproteobacteria bacterium]|nr:FCD domain-containing protein [Alphaproteobacteria bacterium]
MLQVEPTGIGQSRAPRLAEVVAAQLLRLVDRGEFPRGCKLPTEDTLSLRFGVSRPVLREAMQRLKDAGVLQSQRGSGTVVMRGTAPGAALFLPLGTMADLLRLYEFRISLEGNVAALAAERHDPVTLAAIAEALRHAEDVSDRGSAALLLDLNFAFHRAVACATQNPYHLATVEHLPNFVGLDRLNDRSFGDQDVAVRARRVLGEHRVIFEAIRVRDAGRAQAEMISHIAAARDHVMERRKLV